MSVRQLGIRRLSLGMDSCHIAFIAMGLILSIHVHPPDRSCITMYTITQGAQI